MASRSTALSGFPPCLTCLFSHTSGWCTAMPSEATVAAWLGLNDLLSLDLMHHGLTTWGLTTCRLTSCYLCIGELFSVCLCLLWLIICLPLLWWLSHSMAMMLLHQLVSWLGCLSYINHTQLDPWSCQRNNQCCCRSPLIAGYGKFAIYCRFFKSWHKVAEKFCLTLLKLSQLVSVYHRIWLSNSNQSHRFHKVIFLYWIQLRSVFTVNVHP